MELVQIRSKASSPAQVSHLMTGTGALKSVWLQITSRCNQTCSYCYMNATKESHDRLTFEEILQVFATSKRLGVETMLISGGEPTIVKELADILTASVRDFGFRTYLVTNGTGITDRLTSLLAELDVVVQVSMDTMDEEAYAKVRGLPMLPRIKRNVVGLLERGVTTGLSMPITNVVDQEVGPVLEWALEVGIQNIHVSTSYGQRTGVTDDLTRQNAESVLNELYEFEKQHFFELSIDLIENMIISMVGAGESCATYCTPMSGRAIEIDAKGNVYYCGAITSVPEMALGNVLSPTFEPDFVERRRSGTHLSFSPDRLPICSSCEYVRMCKGGCRSQALFYTGDLFNPVSHCADLKRVFSSMVADHRSGALDELISFLQLAHGDGLSSHTKCF